MEIRWYYTTLENSIIILIVRVLACVMFACLSVHERGSRFSKSKHLRRQVSRMKFSVPDQMRPDAIGIIFLPPAESAPHLSTASALELGFVDKVELAVEKIICTKKDEKREGI